MFTRIMDNINARNMRYGQCISPGRHMIVSHLFYTAVLLSHLSILYAYFIA